MWKWSWLWALPLMRLIAALGCSGDERGSSRADELGTASGALTSPIQHDFEDGTLQGWIPRGGTVVLGNTTEAAFGGTRSLKTTGRTAGFNGPSFNLLGQLTKGATYQVTVSVRLVTGEAPTTVRVTMQRTPAGGTNQFDSIASNASVTDAAWVTLSGVYSFTTDVTGLLLYVEATSATASYYIDSFSITQLAPPPGPPGNTSGATADFETNTPEGWTSRTGTEVVTVTSADKHGGNFSLLTTNRTAAWGASFHAQRFRSRKNWRFLCRTAWRSGTSGSVDSGPRYTVASACQ